MISPRTTPPTPSASLPIDPYTLSLITSPTILPLILTFSHSSTLAACLRVSHSISHLSASILYRDISLAHILPPVLPSPSLPDTRTPFLGYVRTLRLPPHLLYDPSICTAMFSKMRRLSTVIVPADWQGWILCPNIHKPIFAHLPGTPPRRLKVYITGLKSPAALINNGLVQSDLLGYADELVLSIDYLSPEHRDPNLKVTTAGGLTYDADLPESVKRLTVLLPRAPEGKERRMRLPAGFDMGADSGFFDFHAPLGRGMVDYESERDAAPDLARVLAGRKAGCKVSIVLDANVRAGGGEGERTKEEAQEHQAARIVKLKGLKQRTELLVGGIIGTQGGEDATAEQKREVRWLTPSDWQGAPDIQMLLKNRTERSA